MNFHMTVSITGARARLIDPATRNVAKRILERNTIKKAREFLDRAEAAGLEVIPFASCDNRDDKGHCLGHDRKKEI